MRAPKSFVPDKYAKELKDIKPVPSMSLEEFLKTKKEGKLKGYYAMITGLEGLAYQQQKSAIENHITKLYPKTSYSIETTHARTGCYWRESTYSINIKMFEYFDELLIEGFLDLIERHEDKPFALVLDSKALTGLKRSILYQELNKKMVKVELE